MPADRTPRRRRRRLRAAGAATAGLLAVIVAVVQPTLASFVDAGTTIGYVGSSPAQVEPFVDISAGTDHVLAISADRRLWGWGSNASGQLGDGTTITRSVPQPVALPEPVAMFSAGTDVSIAVTVSGVLYTWGHSDYTSGGATPTPVALPSGFDITQLEGVDAGGRFFMMWGGGQLYTWGDNGSRRLGRGTANVRDNVPGRVTVQSMTSNHVHAAAAGRYGGAATWGDRAAAWGASHGESGQSLWGLLQFTRATFVQLAMGHETVMGLTASGDLHWSRPGNDFAKQSGLSGPISDVSISLATAYSEQTYLAVTGTGGLYAWMNNATGQFGTGDTTSSTAPRSVAFAGQAGRYIVRAAAGTGFSLILAHPNPQLGGGAMWATGGNTLGQLGDGSFTSRLTFAPVSQGLTWPDS